MKSRFDSSRIFNDTTGWHVVMRESDKNIIQSMKLKRVGNQHIMGPFSDRNEVIEWLEGYLALHSENRINHQSHPEKVATHT